MAALELTGQRFGRLVALERAGSDGFGAALWRCACDCGAETVVTGMALRRGRTRSCGCLTGAAPIVVGPSDAPRFWVRVGDREPDECWRWTGILDADGYGRLTVGGASRLAHRISWVLAHGNPDPRLKVCHRCDNPRCVNPAHLFLGSDKDNGRDAVAKGRNRFPDQVGASNPNARISPEEVREARALYASGLTQRAIGDRFGLSQGHVSTIVRGGSWASVAEGQA